MSLPGAALALSKLTALQCLDASWLGGDVSEDHDLAVDRGLRVRRRPPRPSAPFRIPTLATLDGPGAPPHVCPVAVEPHTAPSSAEQPLGERRVKGSAHQRSSAVSEMYCAAQWHPERRAPSSRASRSVAGRSSGGRAVQAAHDSGGVSSWADVVAGSLTALRELRVGGGGLTDFDLLSLRPLTALTHLDIADSQEVHHSLRTRRPPPPPPARPHRAPVHMAAFLHRIKAAGRPSAPWLSIVGTHRRSCDAGRC